MLDAQDDGAVRVFEIEGQGGGHLVGGCEVFGGVGKEGFGVDVGADGEQVTAWLFVGGSGVRLGQVVMNGALGGSLKPGIGRCSV